MTVFVPRPYQHLIRSFGLEHDRGNVFSSPGTGKTGAGLDIFESRRLMGEAKRLLVLAPKRVALTTWVNEVPKWQSSFGHLTVAAAIGTPDERLAALRRNADITTINYEGIEWLYEQYGDNWPFNMVIADESTRLKGMRVSIQRRQRKDGSWGPEFIQGQGAKRAGILARIAHKHVRYWINATGSPAPNGLVDLWAQAWFVDAGFRLGNSFDAFSKRWFRPAWGSSKEQQILEPLPYAEAEIQALMRQCSITVDAKDWFPLEKVIERNVYIDLPPAARRHYREMEKELFTEVESESKNYEVEVFNAGSKAQKCLQIASGSLIHDTDSRAWVKVHDEKMEALRSIVEETNGQNLLVTYQFTADRDRILKAFPKARFLDSNPRTVEEFQQGKIRMLVCHPKSAGHGLDLQHNCWTMVDYSSGWNLEEDEQVIERIGPTRQYQIGQKRSVFRYRIVARDTIEELSVLPRLLTKASVQNSLKDAMKLRK